jgi:ribosomal protein L19E
MSPIFDTTVFHEVKNQLLIIKTGALTSKLEKKVAEYPCRFDHNTRKERKRENIMYKKEQRNTKMRRERIGISRIQTERKTINYLRTPSRKPFSV